MRSFVLVALLLLPALVFGQEDVVRFNPLTGLPGLQGISNAESISQFLNVLYRLCVGAAATLAVIQIIRAGFLWMKGDSVTGSKEARSLIVSSVFGLVLVLSPAIVFGIIDPRILSLSLDTTSLKLSEHEFTGGVTEEQVSTIAEQTVAAARNCGIDATDEHGRCAWENRANEAAARACFPSMTDAQFACMFAELSRRVAEGLDGTLVDSNQYRYTGQPNSFISLGIGIAQGASCKTLRGASYSAQTSCEADLSRFEGEITELGWSMLFRCQQLTDSGGFLITAENLCVEQPDLP